MTDKTLDANAPQEIETEVKGHGRMAGKAFELPDANDAEVEGHFARAGRAVPEDEPEVEGHGVRSGRAIEHEDNDADVEGHMHPILAPGVARSIDNDRMAQAERDSRAAAAAGDRDGGILEKIRRFTGR